MNKEEFIRKYGEVAYGRALERNRNWQKHHREKVNITREVWRKSNPDKVMAHNRTCNREHLKGGKLYKHVQKYKTTELQGERNRIRKRHARLYRVIKQATPNSVFHHEWLFGTAEYRGVALVEKEAHKNGIIKVIKVLEGEITVFTEKEIRGDM